MDLQELAKAMGAALLDVVLIIGAVDLARRAAKAVRRWRSRRG